MRKWKNSLLVAVVAALCMAQTATEYESPDVMKVAAKFNCPCGCKQNMACQMQPKCHICIPARQKILTMQRAGKSEQEITASFVAEYGKDVVVIPPGPLGAAGPYAALAVGLGMVILAIRYYLRPRRPAEASVVAAPADDAMLQKYQDQIEKDLDKLD